MNVHAQARFIRDYLVRMACKPEEVPQAIERARGVWREFEASGLAALLEEEGPTAAKPTLAVGGWAAEQDGEAKARHQPPAVENPYPYGRPKAEPTPEMKLRELQGAVRHWQAMAQSKPENGEIAELLEKARYNLAVYRKGIGHV